MRKTSNTNFEQPTIPPALPMKETAAYTHTSLCFIRKGVQDGTIRHFRSGKKIYVLVPALLKTLEQLADAECK